MSGTTSATNSECEYRRLFSCETVMNAKSPGVNLLTQYGAQLHGRGGYQLRDTSHERACDFQ